MRSAALAAGRDPASVGLVAVTKGQTAESVHLAATAGVTDFGENYVQEAVTKIHALAGLRLRWHFIGRLQANKTRIVAEHFDWVHSVDRAALAQRLSQQRPFHAPPLDVCIQVALIPEPRKGGVAAHELEPLARTVASLPQLRLRGLMCLPQQADAVPAGEAFHRLRLLLERLNGAGMKLDTLSMGMSADFESAIAAGATLVRIGTAIFGTRS